MSANLALLLRLINSGADTSFLVKQGLTYAQIASLFGIAIEKGYLARDDKTFFLTPNGQNWLTLEEGKNSKSQGKWISPDLRYKTPQLGPDEVFLPRLIDLKN